MDPEVKLINHDKYAKLAKIASDFQRFQVVGLQPSTEYALISQPYNLGEIPEVQAFLKKVLNDRGSGSVDALYRKSCQSLRALQQLLIIPVLLEPRQGQERIGGGLERPAWLKI